MAATSQSTQPKLAPQAQQVKQNFINHPYVQQASRIAQSQVASLDGELNKYPVLRDLERKSGVPKAYGALGLAASAIPLLFFNFFGLAGPVSMLIGFAVPAYLSIQAIESPGTDDDKQWLTYWIVFGAFNLLEAVAARPILYWIPMWYVLKTLFIIWLFLPGTRGAQTLYGTVLRPVFAQVKSRAQAPRSSTAGYSTGSSSYTSGSTTSGLGSTTSGLGSTTSGLGSTGHSTSSNLGSHSGLGSTLDSRLAGTTGGASYNSSAFNPSSTTAGTTGSSFAPSAATTSAFDKTL